MNRKEYNGWTNYETWCIALWMDNEEGSANYWSEECENVCKREDDTDDRIRELSDLLKDQHEEALPELKGFAADMLNAAMSEVDWYEIARHLVDDYEAEHKDEEAA